MLCKPVGYLGGITIIITAELNNWSWKGSVP